MSQGDDIEIQPIFMYFDRREIQNNEREFQRHQK